MLKKQAQEEKNKSILLFLSGHPRSDVSQIMEGIKAGEAKGYARQEIEQGNLYQLISVQLLVKVETSHTIKVYSLSSLGERVVASMKD